VGISKRAGLTAAALCAMAIGAAGCGSSGTSSVAGSGATSGGEPGVSGNTIKVGILHSLSGTMAISEVSVKDSEMLAINQINAAGGVLGKKLVPVVEDGASDWPTFAEKAQKLIQSDHVAAVFGGWTSASRKAMLPVFERLHSLLYYPVQYEGLESSPDIYYIGATTNQQILPGLEYLQNVRHVKKLFLVGSDYVFPRTANKEIKQWAAAHNMQIAGEEYAPLGSTEFSTIVNKVQAGHPDAVFNTLNGDSNVAFFKQLAGAGLPPSKLPVLSVSIAEDEVRGIGADKLKGQLVAWNYYQTDTGAVNAAFVKAYKSMYGQNRVTDDPIEAGYLGVKIWAAAVAKAGSTDINKVRAASAGLTINAPEGKITVNGTNHHITKTARIGLIMPNGLIKTVWSSTGPVTPDPYLKSYPWWKG
jgi:urea transport system substrate-binding protein